MVCGMDERAMHMYMQGAWNFLKHAAAAIQKLFKTLDYAYQQDRSTSVFGIKQHP
jgi:hypothetical protein